MIGARTALSEEGEEEEEEEEEEVVEEEEEEDDGEEEEVDWAEERVEVAETTDIGEPASSRCFFFSATCCSMSAIDWRVNCAERRGCDVNRVS